MGVEMTPAETWSFVTGAHTGILTTLRRDGSPVALPLWFAVIDESIYLRTLAGSAKMKRLHHDPRVSFLVEAGQAWSELRAVLVSGRATPVVDAELCQRIEEELTRKYDGFEVPRDAPDATKRHYGAETAYVRIDADRSPLTWDNRKIRRRSAA